MTWLCVATVLARDAARGAGATAPLMAGVAAPDGARVAVPLDDETPDVGMMVVAATTRSTGRRRRQQPR